MQQFPLPMLLEKSVVFLFFVRIKDCVTALTRKRTTVTTKGSLFQIRTLNKKRSQEKTSLSSTSHISQKWLI